MPDSAPPTRNETTTPSAELAFLEQDVSLTLTNAPAMTINTKTVTPVAARIFYQHGEDADAVAEVRIDGRDTSGHLAYYPLNDPAHWPGWLTVLVEQHRPVAGPLPGRHCAGCNCGTTS